MALHSGDSPSPAIDANGHLTDRFFAIQHHFPSQLIPYLRPCRSRVDGVESDGQRASGDRQRSGERVGSRRFGTKAESPGLAVK